MKLQKVRNDLLGARRVWCGPAVISAITGETLSRVEMWIKLQRGSHAPINGVHLDEVRKILIASGFRAVVHLDYLFKRGERPTFAAWLREPRDADAVYVVLITRHFVAVQGDEFVDSGCQSPVSIAQAPHKRRRVVRVLRVTRD